MKILVIDEEFPFPLNSGKRIRSFNLLSRLAGGHEISYLAYGSSDSMSARELQRVSIETIAVKDRPLLEYGGRFYASLALNLLSKYPYSVTKHYSGVFEQALRDELKRREYDLILCEWSLYSIFVKTIKDIKKVAVAHNLEACIWRRYYNVEKNLPKKWYMGLQMMKMAKFERELFEWVDGAVAVSSDEADVIRSFGTGIPVEVVANGVDTAYFQGEMANAGGKELVFSGSMDWRPNQDAASYFVREIFPLLRSRQSDISLTIVGKNPSPQVSRLGQTAGVKVTGTVDDIRPYLRSASVAVVPLRIGGGSRLKILECLAMGIPVVSTSVGAEGLYVANEESILIADTPSSFARQVERLFQDADLYRRLSHAGRHIVAKNYKWEMLAEKLDLFLTRIVGAT